MRLIQGLSIGTLIMLLGLVSCQQPASTGDIATAVKNQLAISNPAWSGSTWTTTTSGSVGSSITENTTTISATTSTTTQKSYTLTTTVNTLVLNADKTFTLTSTSANGANFGKSYIQDNYYWSTSTASLNAPALPTTGTYKSYIQSPSYTTPFFFLNGVSNNLYGSYSIPSSSYSIGTTSSTAYNGAALYPVTYVVSGLAGKTTAVLTYSGTWGVVAASSALNSEQLQLNFTSASTVAYTYTTAGVVATTTTTAPPLPTGQQILYPSSTVNPDTNASTYNLSINFSPFYYSALFKQ